VCELYMVDKTRAVHSANTRFHELMADATPFLAVQAP
jgi:hypothetical protein